MQREQMPEAGVTSRERFLVRVASSAFGRCSVIKPSFWGSIAGPLGGARGRVPRGPAGHNAHTLTA
jgi:hypothetical protein